MKRRPPLIATWRDVALILTGLAFLALAMQADRW